MDIPPLLRQAAHEPAHLVGAADIELHGQHGDAIAHLGRDVGRDLLEGVDAARRQDQTQAVARRRPRELERGRPPDARRCPRYHHRLVLEALGGC